VSCHAERPRCLLLSFFGVHVKGLRSRVILPDAFCGKQRGSAPAVWPLLHDRNSGFSVEPGILTRCKLKTPKNYKKSRASNKLLPVLLVFITMKFKDVSVE
jgi:hypothetical protein